MKPMRSLHRLSPGTVMNRNVGAVLVLGLLLGVPSLWAHHGLAEFDATRTVRMQGAVTDFRWINPHAFIYADLKDENGKVANWKLEMGSLRRLKDRASQRSITGGGPIEVRPLPPFCR